MTTMSKLRAGYILLILSAIFFLNQFDRNLIGILIPDLKRDLHLSDGQVGLLSGLAFAFCYCLGAVPIARFADRGRRVQALAGALTFWSLMTALCGAATSFGTMVLARMGVGLGESGGAPTMQALIAETFHRKWRGTALGINAVAGGLGGIAALQIGGLLAERHGWRMAFVIAAIPGFVIALLLIATVREPNRGAEQRAAASVALREVLATLAKRRSFVWTVAGLAIALMASYGAQAWVPTYLMRHYGLGAGQVGAAYARATGPALVVGILFSGVISDWLSRRDQRWSVWLLAISFGLAIPVEIGFLMLNDFGQVLLLAVPMTFLRGLWMSPTYAVIQHLAGPRFRSTGAAIFMLVANIVGQGMGPTLVGWLSDLLAAAHGRDALRFALLFSTATYAIGMVGFFLAARTVRADIADADRDEG